MDGIADCLSVLESLNLPRMSWPYTELVKSDYAVKTGAEQHCKGFSAKSTIHKCRTVVWRGQWRVAQQRKWSHLWQEYKISKSWSNWRGKSTYIFSFAVTSVGNTLSLTFLSLSSGAFPPGSYGPSLQALKQKDTILSFPCPLTP